MIINENVFSNMKILSIGGSMTNYLVKLVHFISQERLLFALNDIVIPLLGDKKHFVMAVRSFIVIMDGLQKRVFFIFDVHYDVFKGNYTDSEYS